MEKCRPVPLEPFMHQVSGHSHMFVYDSTTVCKTLCNREFNFYSTLPTELHEFTPEFRGVIEVDAHEDRDGDITLVGLPECLRGKSNCSDTGCSPGSSGKSDNDSDGGGSSSTACCHHSSRKSKLRKKVNNHDELSQKSSGTLFENHGSKLKPGSAGTRNPWSIRCHSIRLDEIRRADKTYKGRKFILLENVVSQFHRPCVLDVKMGTRQYGDDETDEKRERKNRRCMTTTSAKMGIRMCGMQVYQVHSRKFICRDKYFGRKLTEDGLHEILYQFLHNGARLRLELIDSILERLRLLHSVLFKQTSFRFYSSSLLIMYDGAMMSGTPAPRDLDLCDNCEGDESRRSAGSDDRDDDEVVVDDDDDSVSSSASDDQDSDYKKKKSSTVTWVDSTMRARLPARELDRVHKTSATDMSSSGSSHSETEDNAEACTSSKERIRRSRVDVRMIDFAHTTHLGMDDRTKYHGPDTGYLIGLENLIKMFDELKRQEEQS